MMEYQFDKNTLLIGDVNEEDTSFDHEFGTKKQTSREVTDFGVIVFINGMDYDVTSSFKESTLEMFKQAFLEHFSQEELLTA